MGIDQFEALKQKAKERLHDIREQVRSGSIPETMKDDFHHYMRYIEIAQWCFWILGVRDARIWGPSMLKHSFDPVIKWCEENPWSEVNATK